MIAASDAAPSHVAKLALRHAKQGIACFIIAILLFRC
jgi:hypothetical protein